MDAFFDHGSETSSIVDGSSVSPFIIVQDRIRRLIWKIAGATFLLMAVGSATRVMNAGLACPDWPLCYGQLVPSQQMNLQVFLEWFHRLDAGLIVISTVGLVGASWWQRRRLPAWVPWVSTLALIEILSQAALGGLTVTELLRFDIVTAHLGTALLFFCTLLTMGFLLVPYRRLGSVGSLPMLSAITAGLVYGQSLLGGLVGSRWALHQCFGSEQLCSVMNSHLIGVLPVSLLTLILVVKVGLAARLVPLLKTLGWGIAGLWLLQIGLGVATFYLRLEVAPLTVAHQAVGAALLGSLVAFSVIGFREQASRLGSVG